MLLPDSCAHRGLVTGHSGTSSAVINHICNVLLKDLLGYINTRISATVNTLPIGSMKLDAVVKQFGQLDFSDLSSLKVMYRAASVRVFSIAMH